MRKWIVLGAAVAVIAAGAMAVASPGGQDTKSSDQDRAKVQKELDELMAQRAKLDARIRELRRQSGRSPYIVAPRIELKEMTPDQRKEVEKALSEAKRALEEARKSLPEGQRALVPDMSGILDNSVRLWVSPNGFNGNLDGAWSPEQREEFRKSMESMREQLRKQRDEMRTLVIPRIEMSRPSLRGDRDADMRSEINRLQRELDALKSRYERNQREKLETKPQSDIPANPGASSGEHFIL